MKIAKSHAVIGLLLLSAAPSAAVSVASFDRDGNTTGSEDKSVGGVFAHETIVGTLTVNRDCTISLLPNVYDTPATGYVHRQSPACSSITESTSARSSRRLCCPTEQIFHRF